MAMFRLFAFLSIARVVYKYRRGGMLPRVQALLTRSVLCCALEPLGLITC